MTQHHSIASVAALVGEPTRAAMLLALLDGRALPAGELARVAGLSAAAASLHLAKLTQGGLVTVRKEGRHRYYALASADVALALETLGTVATRPSKSRALSPSMEALRGARTCYDHLAGQLAVALALHLERERYLNIESPHSYAVTGSGARWLERTFDLDMAVLESSRRPLARRCLDWTERRPHVAGALGAALLTQLLDKRWVRPVANSRALRLTSRGRVELAKLGFASALSQP
jgi:DNA-binding transcriptional ArsR family regulator